ncbi:hypothetical protein CEXT_120301 [Caerostris extrusa]|uniref:Uncharacterized protein n=1 Tax=Caerostris extrusa TaxID=172846 RepID=A0AAV4MTM9_CAEEX|nr:hypothetical protein CEXT_120301 [Caerostris extrusa]
MLVVSTYTCDQCGAETFKTVNSLLFMSLINCESGSNVDDRNLEEDCICRLSDQVPEDDALEDHELTQAKAEEILNIYNYDMMASSISPEIFCIHHSP